MFKIVFKNKISLEESLKIKNVFIKALKRVEKRVKNKNNTIKMNKNQDTIKSKFNDIRILYYVRKTECENMQHRA